MAFNIPPAVVNIHNKMVFDLSKQIGKADLDTLKSLLDNNPLHPVDMESIDSVPNLFTCLMDKTFISYGNYENLITKLEYVKPVLGDIVRKCTDDIDECTKDTEDSDKRQAHTKANMADTQVQKNVEETKIKEAHAEMILKVSSFISPALPTDWQTFQTLMICYLDYDEVYGTQVKCFSDICRALMRKGVIAYGKYDKLRSAVEKIHVDAAKIIDKATLKINAVQLRK